MILRLSSKNAGGEIQVLPEGRVRHPSEYSAPAAKTMEHILNIFLRLRYTSATHLRMGEAPFRIFSACGKN